MQNLHNIRQLLAESSHIRIVPGSEYPLDTLPSALGLARTLEQVGKRTFIHYGHRVPARLAFLPIRTHGNEGGLASLDCTVALGPCAEDLCEPQRAHPLIIISTQKTASEAGAAAYIDANASSTAELVTRFLKITWEEYIDSEVATGLLAGIIGHTENFRHERTRPQTLFAAAYLMGKDADRNAIINALYKERPLELIRLWGRALQTITYEEEGGGTAWVCLTPQDFYDTGTNSSAIPALMRELIAAVPQARFALVLWQERTGDEYATLIHATEEDDVREISALLGGTRKKNNLVTSLRASSPQEAASALLRMVSPARTR